MHGELGVMGVIAATRQIVIDISGVLGVERSSGGRRLRLAAVLLLPGRLAWPTKWSSRVMLAAPILGSAIR